MVADGKGLSLQHKPGDMIGGYRVLRELGRGAGSTIYAVEDAGGKQVRSLKHVEKTDEKSDRFLEQAEREYQVAAAVGSRKVRRVEKIIRKKKFLWGRMTDLYLVMEMVEGRSCEQNPPKTIEDALEIFEQVAEGLAAMHAKGFAHADMKPNNIIVDDKLNARIIDLGQSCKVGTIKQRIQGTPNFIAPEQVHRRAITSKTDVYNFGASLYWVLTRTYVPTALDANESPVDASLVPRPSKPSEINPRVPAIVDRLVMDCVEADPDMRPTMQQIFERIGKIRKGV